VARPACGADDARSALLLARCSLVVCVRTAHAPPRHDALASICREHTAPTMAARPRGTRVICSEAASHLWHRRAHRRAGPRDACAAPAPAQAEPNTQASRSSQRPNRGRRGRPSARDQPQQTPQQPQDAAAASNAPAASEGPVLAHAATAPGVAQATWFSAVAPLLPAKGAADRAVPNPNDSMSQARPQPSLATAVAVAQPTLAQPAVAQAIVAQPTVAQPTVAQPVVAGVPPPSASGASDASEQAVEDDAAASCKRAKVAGKNVYEVEKILQVRHVNEEVQYLIKWKGWASKHNTWEPMSHLQNLQSDIAVFHAEKSRASN